MPLPPIKTREKGAKKPLISVVLGFFRENRGPGRAEEAALRASI
jgi:hypothetical protein